MLEPDLRPPAPPRAGSRRVDPADQGDPAVGGLLPLPGTTVRACRRPSGTRAGEGARGREPGRRARGQGRPPRHRRPRGRHPLARALPAGASSRGAVRRRSGARPARRHPSERVGLAAVGLRPRSEAARRAHRLPRVQLGQPDQQGPRARRPGPGARLERAPEAGGRRAPAPARRAHPADRCARVRPLVRPGARQLARVVLRRGRPRPGETGRALRLLGPVRRFERGAVRAAVDRGGPGAGRRARRRRAPDPAAPAQHRAVERRRARRAGGQRLAEARRGAARRGVARPLLRLDLSRRRRGRDQHERPDRGGDRRPAGPHDPGGRVSPHPARHPAFPVSDGRGLRPPLRRADARRARGTAGRLAG